MRRRRVGAEGQAVVMFEGPGCPPGPRCDVRPSGVRLHDRLVIPRSGLRRLRYSVRYVPSVGAEITVSISHTRLGSPVPLIRFIYIDSLLGRLLGVAAARLT